MRGETDLETLLRALAPRADPRPYVFASVPRMPSSLDVTCRGMFREDEGVTLIMDAGAAGRVGATSGPLWACITLTVGSSLLAVGLLARVATVLAAAGISVNPVAAYHHDHLFVPWQDRDRALDILQALARQTRVSRRGRMR